MRRAPYGGKFQGSSRLTEACVSGSRSGGRDGRTREGLSEEEINISNHHGTGELGAAGTRIEAYQPYRKT